VSSINSTSFLNTRSSIISSHNQLRSHHDTKSYDLVTDDYDHGHESSSQTRPIIGRCAAFHVMSVNRHSCHPLDVVHVQY